MPLVTTQKMLSSAQKGGYAVGAFNIENMEMAQAVVEAAQELGAPVILQTTPSTVKYASVYLYHALVAGLAERADIPVALHLDHGNSFALAEEAIRAGYTSVMIDGSQEPFQENIRLAQRVVAAAKKDGLPVEAELGQVGGKEDGLESEDVYTDPQQAKTFVEQTGVHSLAVAIGTAHGIYHGVPRLDVKRLAQIQQAVPVPLVLHGASGLPDAQIQACIRAGICKVNFATELRMAYSKGAREILESDPKVFDPKIYGRRSRELVKEQVKNRMAVCGCVGKA